MKGELTDTGCFTFETATFRFRASPFDGCERDADQDL